MEPEEKLWKLNCITYSVAVAWRQVNDDYQRTPWWRKQRPSNVKCGKENLAERQVLSKASGENEAIQKQSKMTKRRVKRRKQISAKCRTLFVKDLIFMMLSPNQNASFWSGGWIEKPKEKLVENHTCLEAISNQSEVCKMFLNLIFIKKDQRMGSKSCNKL